ncbi:MAG: hypothetical protein HEQ27_00860 [Dolichospermum sp. JUN01]|jgi:hypothetical protein|nr:hypothetical protein [Dolichospermum sp. JUN01]MBS9393162.1 hypothetical protein [Dolichospermum sp. OL01]MCO5796796.1 hypothetical protein [Dolichospermum sp. OL03]MCS6281270.1 hypothetical protein [Dolichospermum sp.]QSV58380.1 MAG: hypothetical protein HEQ29_08385 [Dolichospermum sp. LBC05a]
MSDIQLAIIKILNHVGFDYNPYTYYYRLDNVKLDYLQNAFVIHDCHCIITFSLDNREHTISADINGIHIVTKTGIPEYLTIRTGGGGKYQVDEDYRELEKFNEYISENIDSVRLYLNGDFLIFSDAIRGYSDLNLYMEKAKLICIESHLTTKDIWEGRAFFCKKLIFEKPDPDLYDDKKVKFVATEVHSVKILEKPEKYHSFYNHNGPIGWNNRWRENEE